MRRAGRCGAMAVHRIKEECFISPSQEQLLNSLPDWEDGRAKDAAADFTPEELRPAGTEAPTARSVSSGSPESTRVHYGDLESQEGVEWGSPEDSFNGAFESDRSQSPRRRLCGIVPGDFAEPSAAASCADGGVLKSPRDDRSDAWTSPAPGRGGPVRSLLLDEYRDREDAIMDRLERKTKDESGGNLQSLHGIAEVYGAAEQSEVFRRARVSTGDSDEAIQGGAGHGNRQKRKQKVSHIAKHEQTGGDPQFLLGTAEDSGAAQLSEVARVSTGDSAEGIQGGAGHGNRQDKKQKVSHIAKHEQTGGDPQFLLGTAEDSGAGDSAEGIQGGAGHGNRQEKKQTVSHIVKHEQTGGIPQPLHGTAEDSGAAQQSEVARPARVSTGNPAEAIQAGASLMMKLPESINYHISEDGDGKGTERVLLGVEWVEGHVQLKNPEGGAENCPTWRPKNDPREVFPRAVERPSRVSPDQVKSSTKDSLRSREEKEVSRRGTGAYTCKQSGQEEAGQGSRGEAVASRTEPSFSFGGRDEVQDFDTPDLFGKQDDSTPPTKECSPPVSSAGPSSLASARAGNPGRTRVCEKTSHVRDFPSGRPDGDQVSATIGTDGRVRQGRRFFPKSVMDVVRRCSGDLPVRTGSSANASSDLLAAAVQSGVTLPLPFQRRYPFSF